MPGVIIEDRVAELQIPKAKRIQIGDLCEGEATPTIAGDQLRWHAVLQPRRPVPGILLSLLQGHGGSVVEAIGDAIVKEREEIRARTMLLAQIEQICGTANFTDKELVRRLQV